MGMVTHSCSPNTWEAEARLPSILGELGYVASKTGLHRPVGLPGNVRQWAERSPKHAEGLGTQARLKVPCLLFWFTWKQGSHAHLSCQDLEG